MFHIRLSPEQYNHESDSLLRRQQAKLTHLGFLMRSQFFVGMER
jgi:hypothetical protein